MRRLAIVVFVVAASTAAFARAQAPATPAELAASAQAHADRGEWADAARDFGALAAALGPGHASALDVEYNEALCLMNAGAFDDASTHFTHYAAAAPSDADRAVARQLIDEIVRRTATVTIDTHGLPAEVHVGSLVVGHAPGTVRIAADEDVSIELHADGHAAAHRTLHLAPGATSLVDVVLVALDAAANDARQRIERGDALYRDGQYDAALTEFEAAYDLLEGGGDLYLVLHDVAQCHQRLGHFDLAARYLRRYLAEAPADEPGRAAVQASLDALVSLLGTLTVTADVSARVFVDGREVGTSGAAIEIATGTHDVEVRARGRESERRTVQIAAGRGAVLELTMRRLAHGLSPEPFVAFVSAAGAALVATVVLGTYAVVYHDGVARWGPDSATTAERDELARLTLTTDVLIAASGALALASIVLGALTDFQGTPPDATLRPVAAPLAGGLVVGAYGRF